jgi:2-polyprenyl-3-methyl-5-hydroxy-6-metoxy-1,4-benzoquinol methylase
MFQLIHAFWTFAYSTVSELPVEPKMMLLDFILGSPRVWHMTRIGLDAVFGLYRKRIALLREWGLFGKEVSLLDIGCGTGVYANVTRGAYLGIDNNASYIAYAQAQRRGANRAFRCMDAAELDAGAEFDVVLMADVLHHLDRKACCELLSRTASLALHRIVCFEPVTDQLSWLGHWFIRHDRGRHVRPRVELHRLFMDAGIALIESRELRLGPIATQAILASPTRNAE